MVSVTLGIGNDRSFDIKFAGARKIVWRRCRGAAGACGERGRLIALAFGDGRTLFRGAKYGADSW